MLGSEKHLARALVAARRYNLTSLKQCGERWSWKPIQSISCYHLYHFLFCRKLCFTLLQLSSLHRHALQWAGDGCFALLGSSFPSRVTELLLEEPNTFLFSNFLAEYHGSVLFPNR